MRYDIIARGIYAIVNKVNEKIYIGKSLNLKKRWNQHINLLRKNKHENIALQRAFNKYGENNFTHKILIVDDSLSDDELYEIERMYILLFETDRHKKGYNIALGRGGLPEWTEEQKRVRSLKYSGKGNPFYGKTHSPETVKKIIENTDHSYSQSEEYRKKISDVMKGRIFTEEHSRNKSLAQMGGKNPSAKKVSINGKNYDCIADASRELNIKRKTISRRLNSTSDSFKDYYYI